MKLDFNLLFLVAIGIVYISFQYLIPLMLRLIAPERALAKKRDYTMRKKVAVLVPCFNEGPTAYESIQSHCRSDYPHELLEIVVVDDHSTDDSWEWIQKAVADFGKDVKLTAFKQPVNSGKQDAILRGASLATDADILVCVDSDCIFDVRAVSEIAASFTDETVGAVGGQVRVKNVNDNLLTQMQTIEYYYAFDLMKMFENYLKNLVCISGCLFAISKKAFLEVEKEIATAHFLGVRLSAGEDRYLTHVLLLRGYKTVLNLDAFCWTEVPNQYKKFFLQRWRWARSGVFNFFMTIKSPLRHVRILSPFTVLNMILPMVVNLSLQFSMFYAIAEGAFIQWLINFMMATFILFGPFLLYYAARIRRQSPDQALHAPIFAVLPLVGGWALVSSVCCSFLALFTMDSRSWGTRVSAPPVETSTKELQS